MKCAIEKISACKRETTCINDASSFTFDKVVESKCYNWDSTPKKNICQGLNHRMPFEIFLSLPWAWLQPEKHQFDARLLIKPIWSSWCIVRVASARARAADMIKFFKTSREADVTLKQTECTKTNKYRVILTIKYKQIIDVSSTWTAMYAEIDIGCIHSEIRGRR